MGDTEARPYFVLTLKGQQGPFDKQGIKELVLAGGARPEDQVRNAFGRPLGTIRELVGPIRPAGSGRLTAERPGAASGRQTAERPATGSGRRAASSSTATKPMPAISGRPKAASTSGRGVHVRTQPEVRPKRRILAVLLVLGLLAAAVAAWALYGRVSP